MTLRDLNNAFNAALDRQMERRGDATPEMVLDAALTVAVSHHAFLHGWRKTATELRAIATAIEDLAPSNRSFARH